jgi:hypothetical protein
MFSISRPLIAVSALIAGAVVIADMAQSRTTEATPAATIEYRFPQATEMLTQRSGAFSTKTDRLPVKGAKPAAACAHEHWPYIADECLAASPREAPRAPVRTISFERRVAEQSAPAVRFASLDLSVR